MYFYITLFHCLNVSLWATKPSSTCPELILYYRSFQAGEIVQTLVALASERWAVRKSRRGETQGISCTLPLCFSLSCFLPQVRGHWRAAVPPAVGSLRLCALLGAVAGLKKEKEKKKIRSGVSEFLSGSQACSRGGVNSGKRRFFFLSSVLGAVWLP